MALQPQEEKSEEKNVDLLSSQIESLSKENQQQQQQIELLLNKNKQQQQQIDELIYSLTRAKQDIGRLESVQTIRNARPMNVKFDRYDAKFVKIERDGKVIQKTGGNNCYSCAYSSSGFWSSTTQSWKIKVIKTANGIYDRFGLVKKIYNGDDCNGKKLTTDYGSIEFDHSYLKDGNVYTLIVDSNSDKLMILENGKFQRCVDIHANTTYYPAIQFCDYESAQHFEVV
eukprot:542781_1